MRAFCVRLLHTLQFNRQTDWHFILLKKLGLPNGYRMDNGYSNSFSPCFCFTRLTTATQCLCSIFVDWLELIELVVLL